MNSGDTALPLISVALSTYNGARFLKEQLDSIVRQTYSNLEIVIVDDASSDDTFAILEAYQAQDVRIRLLRNRYNIGFLRSFERALSACTGDFIALADQDDIWLEHKLESLYQDIGDNLLIYSGVSLIDAQGAKLEGIFPALNRLQGACSLSLVMGNCIIGHACLIRRDLLALALPFPRGIAVHDQWLGIVAGASGRLKASDQILSLYRKHDSNVMLSSKRKRKVPRYVKKDQSDDKQLQLARVMRNSGLLGARQVGLLEQFDTLLSQNFNCFYNRELARFLLEHADEFLRLYNKPEKAVRKLCRGSYYFRCLPFS